MMENKININQVEKMTNVSKRNLRFYEKEGLLSPERNEKNGYRVYGEKDIWTIKVIKMFRMLDMPLDEIKEVLENEQTLEQALSNQKLRLEEKANALQAAIQFCDQLKGRSKEIQTLNVDQCLEEMEDRSKFGFFTSWVHDYKQLRELNKERDFTFMPNVAITNARGFSDALFEYAQKENVDIVITKESMYPEFTLNGVEYTAERYYNSVRGIPIAHVHCYTKNREVQSEDIPKGRKKILWLLHKYWLVPALIFIDIILIWKVFLPMEPAIEEWVIPVSLIAMQGAGLYRMYLFHYNEKIY